MTDTEPTWGSAQRELEGDALGQLIRAAGRRPSPSAADYERVRLAAHLSWQMKVHAGRRRRLVWWALAAGVAAAVVLAATLPWAPPPTVATVAVVHGRVERFVADDARWETLLSGAQITAGTQLRTLPDSGSAFAVTGGIVVRARGTTEWTFASATRVLLAAGTLYVDTSPARSVARELEVVTPHGVVRHVGTQYEVRALSAELRVRVREGSVRLQQTAGPSYETPAGEELLLTANGVVEQRPFAPDSAEWQWAEALATPIDLDGGSAHAALQWVAHETGKRLIFEDASAELLARNAIIHGSSVGLEPLQVLEVVMATSGGLDYRLGDGTLVVRRR